MKVLISILIGLLVVGCAIVAGGNRYAQNYKWVNGAAPQQIESTPEELYIEVNNHDVLVDRRTKSGLKVIGVSHFIDTHGPLNDALKQARSVGAHEMVFSSRFDRMTKDEVTSQWGYRFVKRKNGIVRIPDYRTKVHLRHYFEYKATFLRRNSKKDSILSTALDSHLGKVLPEPDSLGLYQKDYGKSYIFEVTGRHAGEKISAKDGIYNGSFPSPSTLPSATIHAGLLKVGQKGRIRVTILKPRDKIRGYNFRIELVGTPEPLMMEVNGMPILPEPPSYEKFINDFQDKIGKTFVFRVTGRNRTILIYGGSRGFYTADSGLSEVAVHQGLLKAGEIDLIKVTIHPAKKTYPSSKRNEQSSFSRKYPRYSFCYSVSKLNKK